MICTDLLLRDHKNSLTVREIVFFFNKELTDKLMGVKKKVEKKKSIALGPPNFDCMCFVL